MADCPVLWLTLILVPGFLALFVVLAPLFQ